jgi:hypothetical protein
MRLHRGARPKVRLRLNTGKAVNRGDKRTRRVRDRVFMKFERSRRYCDRYRCQEKSLAAAEPAIQFSETPPRRERALDRCSRLETPPP